MPDSAIFILLFVAVACGWALGRFGRRKSKPRPGARDLFDDYFVGLNYLLNDEPDEAIDTFIKALEVNGDTAETHLALGALLRRRGKVDKAIKVHQSLLARPGLEQEFADQTRLQLAKDYISSGLLDRAERLLNELLSEDSASQWEALRLLIRIYQKEKEWEKAIDCCRRLLGNPNYKRDQEIRGAAAHYCCEIADRLIEEGRFSQARDYCRRALSFERGSVRAAMTLARIEQQLGNLQTAVKELIKILNAHPEFISQLLRPLFECYKQMENLPEYERLLMAALPDQPDASVALALSELVQNRSGDEAAIEFLNDYLNRQPSLRGMVAMLKLQIPRSDSHIQPRLAMLQELIAKMLSRKPGYQCTQCGYESRNLYWLCPSCQKWDSIKPLGNSRGELH